MSSVSSASEILEPGRSCWSLCSADDSGLLIDADVAWEGEDMEERIREVRLSLLREHAGHDDIDERIDGFVEEIDPVCDSSDTRLQRLPYDDYGPFEGILPDAEIPDLAADPESPLVIETLRSLELEPGGNLFTRTIRSLPTFLRTG